MLQRAKRNHDDLINDGKSITRKHLGTNFNEKTSWERAENKRAMLGKKEIRFFFADRLREPHRTRIRSCENEKSLGASWHGRWKLILVPYGSQHTFYATVRLDFLAIYSLSRLLRAPVPLCRSGAPLARHGHRLGVPRREGERARATPRENSRTQSGMRRTILLHIQCLFALILLFSRDLNYF